MQSLSLSAHGAKIPQPMHRHTLPPTPDHTRPNHPNPAHPLIPKITVQTILLAIDIERVYHRSISAIKSPIKGSRASRGTATEATRCLMPKNANRETRSQHSRRAPEPAASQPAQPERQELAGNDRVSDFSSLTPCRQSVLPVVALSPSIAQAVRSLVLPCLPVRNRRICSETLGNNRIIRIFGTHRRINSLALPSPSVRNWRICSETLGNNRII